MSASNLKWRILSVGILLVGVSVAQSLAPTHLSLNPISVSPLSADAQPTSSTVNDATKTEGSVNLFNDGGLTINDLIRASERLNTQTPSPDEQSQSLDQAISGFNQTRKIQIGPSIVNPNTAAPSPSPSPATP